MKKLLFLLCAVVSISSAQIESSEQIIIAVSGDWISTSGLMYILEKEDGIWKQINIPWQINFGDSGMAWGIGLHSAPHNARMKIERDHRTPAGF
jgi:hypothetical protein